MNKEEIEKRKRMWSIVIAVGGFLILVLIALIINDVNEAKTFCKEEVGGNYSLKLIPFQHHCNAKLLVKYTDLGWNFEVDFNISPSDE